MTTTLLEPPARGLACEPVSCYECGSERCTDLVSAEDDLTGKPGRFRFVVCADCGLAYQNPRLGIEQVKAYYDDEYIAHRKKTDWGLLQPLFRHALDEVDRRKERLVRRYQQVGATTRVLDVGCGAGTFLERLRRRHGASTVGVDLMDMSAQPALEGSRFHQGALADLDLRGERFDLVTLWHVLEHDYDPYGSLRAARALLAEEGLLIVEVPHLGSLSWRLFGDRWPGLQAPQHTLLFSTDALLGMVRRAGFEVLDHRTHGAFPAYFYFFAGAAFKLLRGRGLPLRRALLPYLAGKLVTWPLFLLERRLDLAMQTVVCRRGA